MITIFRSLHAKKMHTMSGVLPAPMTWLVFTLLLSSVAAAAETVKVITTPVFTQIPRLQASKDFQVLVRVEAPPAVQQQRRVPVDLAVVLDVGGGGGTLEAVKKAVKFIIWQIIHDDDRLAIVGPSSSSITWLLGDEANTPDARRNAERSVNELLEPRGEFTSGAGAGAGLMEAVKSLRELPPPKASRSSRARFVILVTDAATTETSSRFSNLVKDDLAPVVVHTLGLGAAHDPSALFSIAKESQGTYSFVDDENMDNITGAIAVCLSGLKDVVAVGTRVIFETPVGSGVTIVGIDSGEYRTSTVTGTGTTDKKTSGEVAVSVLSAGEVKSFLVHLSVPALPSTSSSTTSAVDDCCDKQQLLTARFVVTPSEGDADAPSPSPQAILYVQRPPPEALDGGALLRVSVPVVMNHIARFGVLEMVTTFFFHNEISPLSSSITVEVAAKLRILWEQFVQERQFWSGLDLAALDVEVSRMVASLEAAAAGTISGSSATTAYMLSWMSSYQMQRPTAMGSPNIVAAAFVTVNMQLLLQQAIDGPLCNNGRCPVCNDVPCADPLPAPVLEPSGRGDGTYRVVNTGYPPSMLVDAMNKAMKQMYLALVEANNLRRCDAAAATTVAFE